MKNNVKHMWSIICQKAIVDSSTNNLSLVDVLETINFDLNKSVNLSEDSPISVPFNFEVVNLWTKSILNKKSDCKSKIALLSPKGKQLMNFDVNFSIPSNKRSHRTIVKLNGLSITSSGEYNLEVSVQSANGEYKTVSRTPIRINVKRPINVNS